MSGELPDLTGQEEDTLRKVALSPNTRELEKNLLLNIKDPIHDKGPAEVFRSLGDDAQQKKILATMSGVGFKKYKDTTPESVAKFVSIYPTPLDFEQSAANFLGNIFDLNGVEKYREYVAAMEEFQKKIYGKRYTYYEAMREIHEEAEEVIRRDRKRGAQVYEAFKADAAETEKRLLVKAGKASLNKGKLIGEPERVNEDAEYVNVRDGLFAVFDGAGGEKGGARASSLAAETFSELAENREVKSGVDLRDCLMMINQRLGRDKEAGVTTAVMGKFVEKDGRKKMAYASVGDSRIYIVRGGQAHLITRDEGEGKYISNALGDSRCVVRQYGDIDVYVGDKVVFCSDGLTGDKEEDFIPEMEFASIVSGAENPDVAARGLVERATKRDDRTAVVVEVQ
ncbi:serine/threonine-protein phosphatase [Candidatus Saccharibacteria bacterium]|nr:serine/threonine-protein phosphatase [Candidatus Saccharibacteria bacterium]